MKSQITSISRVVSDLEHSLRFYLEALGFVAVGQSRVSQTLLAALGVEGGANQVSVRLGQELVNLVQFDRPASDLAPNTASDDLWFQHIAIVVSDMDRAHQVLSESGQWHAITEYGPQQLPANDGSVRAFKFTGPDGHPFELIWFPPSEGRPVWHTRSATSPFLGIDHSAISISSTPSSCAFYRSLGFEVEHQTLNVGPKQSLLDAIPGALVDVTSLRLASNEGMGLELLRYHPHGRPMRRNPKSLATDWLNMVAPMTAVATGSGMFQDPDGHRIAVNLE